MKATNSPSCVSTGLVLSFALCISGCASVSKATDRCTSGLYSSDSAFVVLFSTIMLPLTPICVLGNVVAGNTTAEERAEFVQKAAIVGNTRNSVYGHPQGQRGAQRDAAMYETAQRMADKEATAARGDRTLTERARTEGIGCSIKAKPIQHSVDGSYIGSTWVIEPEARRCANGCSGTLSYTLEVMTPDKGGHSSIVPEILEWESERGEKTEAAGQASFPGCARSGVRGKDCHVKSASYRTHTCSQNSD